MMSFQKRCPTLYVCNQQAAAVVRSGSALRIHNALENARAYRELSILVLPGDIRLVGRLRA